MAQKKLKIHNENILPIIKKSLYSSRDVFVRELVSNGCDAIQKCKILRERGELQVADEEFRIDLNLDKDAKTLTFADTGLGMTAEEVEKYIAQIAFSGAEEFVSHYEGKGESEQIIGHFGLGFYSAYMVAKKVELQTLSYKEGSAPVLWSCDGSSEYEIQEGSRTSRGTSICLFLGEDGEEFLDEHKLRSVLENYCSFLPIPIYLNGDKINEKEPLWLKNPSECTEEEYLQFYRQLYPMEKDPMFWIHLNVDYPFHLQGILYFPKIERRFDWNKTSIKLYCNRVFVSDQCKDLIPDYLTALRGVIDSPDIPLNVSRSYLQMDRTVKQLSAHIAKKVADRLDSLYQTDRDKFLQAWSDIETIVKLGVLQDEKFYERAKNFLVWKSLSDEWMTAIEYLGRYKELCKSKIFYVTEGGQESPFAALYQKQGIPVLQMTCIVDSAVMNFLEGKLDDAHFQRVDAAVDESLLDPSKEKTLLDADGKTEAFHLAEFLRGQLPQENLSIEAKSLSSEDVPAFLVIEEQMRRFKESLSLSGQSLPPGMAPKQTLVVNTNSPLAWAIYGVREKDPSLAKELASHLYELSLLSQKEMKPEALPEFISRSSRILQALLSQSR